MSRSLSPESNPVPTRQNTEDGHNPQAKRRRGRPLEVSNDGRISKVSPAEIYLHPPLFPSLYASIEPYVLYRGHIFIAVKEAPPAKPVVNGSRITSKKLFVTYFGKT